VAPNDKEVQHECRYLGSHEQDALKCTDSQPPSPSPDFARKVALEVLGGRRGRYHSTVHVQEQMTERHFDIFDMEYVIRNGGCVEGGEFCEEARNHKYKFRGNVDGVDFDAVFALSAEHDFIQSPLLVLITGCFKTASGKRVKTY